MRKWEKKYKVEVLREDGRWIKQIGLEKMNIKKIKQLVRDADGSYDYFFKQNVPRARIVKIKKSIMQ